MFVGNMVTEAIPARVFALYRIVETKRGISRGELKNLVEPPGIYKGLSSYFSAVLKAGEELKLIENKDNVIRLLDEKKQLKTIDEFRKYVISILPDLKDGQFWRCSNVIVNMNDKIFEYRSVSDSMLSYLSNQMGETITAPMIRGWRFWSQFLGFGVMNDFSFLPNAYVYVKNVISLMGLEKKQEYSMSDFMTSFGQYGRILLPSTTSNKNLNIAMSSALRELHDNGEIILKFGSDQRMNWILYPSKELFNQPVSSIVYKGVKL